MYFRYTVVIHLADGHNPALPIIRRTPTCPVVASPSVQPKKHELYKLPTEKECKMCVCTCICTCTCTCISIYVYVYVCIHMLYITYTS